MKPAFRPRQKPLCLSLILSLILHLTAVFHHSRCSQARKHKLQPLCYILCSFSLSLAHNTQEAQAAAALQSSSSTTVADHPNQVRSPSPSTLAPQNYVQQLASALGLNSANNPNGTTNIASSTDFESLIEMNRRQQQQMTVSMKNI